MGRTYAGERQRERNQRLPLSLDDLVRANPTWIVHIERSRWRTPDDLSCVLLGPGRILACRWVHWPSGLYHTSTSGLAIHGQQRFRAADTDDLAVLAATLRAAVTDEGRVTAATVVVGDGIDLSMLKPLLGIPFVRHPDFRLPAPATPEWSSAQRAHAVRVLAQLGFERASR